MTTTSYTTGPALRVRRANEADATDVATMVREIAAHEDQRATSTSTLTMAGLLARPDVIVLLAERTGRPRLRLRLRQLHLWTGGDVSTSTTCTSAPATATPGSAAG